MESEIKATTTEKKTYLSTLKLSVRRRDLEAGLPGDDAANQNPKIGSSLKGKAPLSGLTLEEERRYLPEVIGIDPTDKDWRKEVRDYWNNISEPVPHDNVSTDIKYPGRIIEFTVEFNNKEDKEAFENAQDFEKKAEISKKGEVTYNTIGDYILFRYCLVYRKVSNKAEDRYKSNNIAFYLHSSDNETKKKYTSFKQKNQARELFSTILDDNKMIDAILRLYKQNPDDSNQFASLEEKHIYLDEALNKNPQIFLGYANDKDIKIKAFILKAVEAGILFNPTNTSLYFFGQDREEKLGESLLETVEFLKSTTDKNVAIKDTIKAQLNSL